MDIYNVPIYMYVCIYMQIVHINISLLLARKLIWDHGLDLWATWTFVFVSCGYYYKLLQMWWFMTQKFILTIWRPKVWNQDASRITLFLEAPGENLFFVSSGSCQHTLTWGLLHHSNLCFCGNIPSSCSIFIFFSAVSLLLCLSLRTFFIEVGLIKIIQDYLLISKSLT